MKVSPKVFKLRGGAGALNVKLIKNHNEAEKFAKKAFTIGFGVQRVAQLKERLWVFKRDKTFTSLGNILKGVARFFFPNNNFKKSTY